MIYIITPYIMDFKIQCKNNNLPYFGGGRSTNDVKWINHVYQLFGIKIFENDKIIYGDQYHKFSADEINRFKLEIVLRVK